MKVRKLLPHVLLYVLVGALALPVASIFANDADAAGWILASGIDGEPYCKAGGDQDCSVGS